MLNSFVLFNFCACKVVVWSPWGGVWGTITWQLSPRRWWGTVFPEVGNDMGGGYILRMCCKSCISWNFSIFFIIYMTYRKKKCFAVFTFTAKKKLHTLTFFWYTSYIFQQTDASQNVIWTQQLGGSTLVCTKCITPARELCGR